LPAFGGALTIFREATWGAVFALVFGLGGCMQRAVLENDVRSAEWKARTLATAADLSIAQAALSAQLVELEALYQRDPSDARVRELLERGYGLMAHGFIELRRLRAIDAGDVAAADKERQLWADAEARGRYYRRGARPPAEGTRSKLESELAEPEAACARHDRAAYEKELNALLAQPESAPEERLQRALLRELASAWLMPNVAARCKF
jgi:hypothetical protein